MKTVNQIGIAALTRLFSKKSFSEGIEMDRAEIVIRQGDAPWWERHSKSSRPFEDDMTIDEGVSFCVWGIELGFKYLDLNPTQSAMACLIDVLEKNEWAIPSHFVRINWTQSSDKSQDSITYNIYRLSQTQEAKLKSMQPSLALTA